MSITRYLAIGVLLVGCAAAPPASSGAARRTEHAGQTTVVPNRNTEGLPAEPVRAEEQPFVAPSPLASGWAHWNSLRGDAYALDAVERFLDGTEGRLQCSGETMVDYRGDKLRYYGAVKVSEPFVARLQRFEELVAETATEVYGRAPRRVRHYGAYSCRTSRNRSYRLSEHALGNAIDVVGFDFGPAGKHEPLHAELPKRLKAGFEVRVARHWTPPSSTSQNPSAVLHARFLRVLTERLQERRDIFRSLIGPSHRGHSDHFHFDMSPWRYVHL